MLHLKSEKLITSPLRYPGGKSKAIAQIIKYFPSDFSEYREPFVGGASVFFYMRQAFPVAHCWINDLNEELYYFWQVAQSNLTQLVSEVEYQKTIHPDGKSLFSKLTDSSICTKSLSPFDRAVRFFILNRATFSGLVDAGGYSQHAFEKRFTSSSIKRLSAIAPVLQNTQITNLDYSDVLMEAGKNVVVYLDPILFG